MGQASTLPPLPVDSSCGRCFLCSTSCSMSLVCPRPHFTLSVYDIELKQKQRTPQNIKQEFRGDHHRHFLPLQESFGHRALALPSVPGPGWAQEHARNLTSLEHRHRKASRTHTHTRVCVCCTGDMSEELRSWRCGFWVIGM